MKTAIGHPLCDLHHHRIFTSSDACQRHRIDDRGKFATLPFGKVRENRTVGKSAGIEHISMRKSFNLAKRRHKSYLFKFSACKILGKKAYLKCIFACFHSRKKHLGLSVSEITQRVCILHYHNVLLLILSHSSVTIVVYTYFGKSDISAITFAL